MWEVLEYTVCDGWVNNWREEDDSPTTFPTKKAAQAELSSFLRDLREAVRRGDMDDCPRRSSFVIRRVGADNSDLAGYEP